jgi:hypothetical protein
LHYLTNSFSTGSKKLLPPQQRPNFFHSDSEVYIPEGTYNPGAPGVFPQKVTKAPRLAAPAIRTAKGKAKKQGMGAKAGTKRKKKTRTSGIGNDSEAEDDGEVAGGTATMAEAAVPATEPPAPIADGGIGCRQHSIHATKLHQYSDSQDLKHYFGLDKGYLHGDKCHGACNWPPSLDPGLQKVLNHRSIFYCNQCNIDYYTGSCDEDAKPYFVCDSCYYEKMPQVRKRVRKRLD